MKVGFLGPRGTFSFEVASNEYETNHQLIEYKSIGDIVRGLIVGEVDECVVPIENSLQGGVRETIDLLIETNNTFIKKEIILNVTQNLMANKDYKLEEIKEIYSHPQALAQCRKFIENNLHNATICEVSSTALAAKKIKNKDYGACISNKSCALEYDLTLIKENIQDNEFNQTRFWILTKNENNVGNKMTIIFSTKHKSGALYKVLGLFYKNDINLTKIESRPAKTILGEYIFLVDLDVNDKIDATILELKNECEYIKILGRY